jgi:modification methylase
MNVIKRINQLHKTFMKMTVAKAVEIGKLLTEQKEKLGHGNWEDWMRTNLEFSAATAKRYMRLYEAKDDLKTVTVSDLSLTDVYKLMDSRTEEEHKARTKYFRERDNERDARRKTFADRKHKYINPPEGIYENQIIHGDCLKVMPKMIDAGYANTYHNITFSPPYNNRLYYGSHYIDSKPYTEYLAMLEKVIALCYQLLCRGGRLIMNIDDMTRLDKDGDHHYTLEADIIQMIRKMNIKLYEYDKIIWYKSNSGTLWRPAWGSYCSPSSPILRNCFETILIYYKEQRILPNTYNTQPDIIKEDFEEWTFNVWEIHPNVNTPHPATFSEDLTDRLITLYSFPKCKILDPFCGTGTTCKSAQRLDRSYTGIDLNANYAQYSRDRLDLTPEQLRDKYTEFLGGKTAKKSKKAKSRELVVSKLNENISFSKAENKKAVA